ncbi:MULTISPECIES: bifunctional 4-hydroxy-2-oxoglutarate aldolase/2-dehydro-3-deoxy-phosphogluconate aldolase [Aneurinibacillus]|jgi:2-dehydro-3-deoxyphosphogluconate aldolase/(4S)-4-hydroxy-2-oxoglutarate aldolase|uniref:2-dehydro-3-deoxy-phosphogluconate aldolase n=1 Tax=Aneurinibacillus danicus TaxID=267746 RepID=A0A511VD53_9BACL|nr:MULTISPECIES: bifunctional 4-hydroxy-2-oxoglutarate aldolase/2-dehydro-3-deoxy-phosphogluconate aldolase [Aneurinibacillus]GEN36351.1 2-dehydro-3-deoxy-phosphogluconate aldolase [Aneurinibacillus danicus]
MIPKVNILQKIVDGGIIAVLRQVPQEQSEALAQSLIEGGVTALEVTVDTPGAFETIKRLSDTFGDRAVIGAGTVLDAESARLAILNGADFIFSPSLHQDVIRMALRYGKAAIPGVMSPTEMITAMEWGADMVKIFPAAALGPRYIKDVKAPLPHVPVIPSGGVNVDNIASFFEAGASAVGIGGNLVRVSKEETADFARIRDLAAKYAAAVKKARVQ